MSAIVAAIIKPDRGNCKDCFSAEICFCQIKQEQKNKIRKFETN